MLSAAFLPAEIACKIITFYPSLSTMKAIACTSKDLSALVREYESCTITAAATLTFLAGNLVDIQSEDQNYSYKLIMENGTGVIRRSYDDLLSTRLIPVVDGRCQLVISPSSVRTRVFKRERPTDIAQLLDEYVLWGSHDLPASTFIVDEDASGVVTEFSAECVRIFAIIHFAIDSDMYIQKCVSVLEDHMCTVSN